MLKLVSLLILIASVSIAPIASAQVTTSSNVPGWIKNTAGWWADETIDENTFVQAIQWLVSNNIIDIPPTTISSATDTIIPNWVKNTAGWWANSVISDDDFVNSIQYLIKVGIMTVPQAEKSMPVKSTLSSNADTGLVAEINELKAQAGKCQEYDKASEVYLCESELKDNLEMLELMIKSTKYELGPIHFYYKPSQVVINSEGNSIVELKLVIKNTDSKNQSIFCTGPSACNYELTDGKKSWVYSANNIPTGRLEMKPDTTHEIKFTFGPPAQRHLERWNYDQSTEYFLKINEPFGNLSMPLELTVRQ